LLWNSAYYFRGTIRIAPDKEMALQEAHQALRFVSTAQKTQLCIFADGSFDREHDLGGYAYAHAGFAPGAGQASYRRQVAKGWPARPGASSAVCEGLAMSQAIKEAIE
jgi:hypothetical protein